MLPVHQNFLDLGYRLVQLEVSKAYMVRPVRRVECEETLALVLQGLDSNLSTNGHYSYSVAGKKEIGAFLNTMGITKPEELLGRRVEAYVRIVRSTSYRPSGIELATIIPISR